MYAYKMISGQYKSISGEDYLTDIKEIVGGRGYAMAVTKEGYLFYTGSNDDNGGVIGNNLPVLKRQRRVPNFNLFRQLPCDQRCKNSARG